MSTALTPTPTPSAPREEAPADATALATPTARAERRARWRKTLYQWHWISSALCLVGMLGFGFTGLTLNNAGVFESAQATVERQSATLPPALRESLAARSADDRSPLPAPVRSWLGAQWRASLPATPAEPSEREITLDLQSPGVDASVRIDRATGRADYERADRGWVAYLNDLHKGRHAGLAWSWFIDLFAVATLVFSITGLLILQLHAAARPLVWPLTALGLVVPVLLALLLIH
jgi:hypothetical protein